MKIATESNSAIKFRLTDEQLIARYKTGEGSRRQALEALVKRHGPAVYRHALQRLHDQDEAMDIVQEVEIRVMRFLQRFDERSRFSTWLYRITENQCLTRLSLNARTATLQRELSQETVLSVQNSPTQEDKIEAVRQALAKLSDRDRDILQLRFYRELSLEELAKTLGISLSACKMRFYRALKRFRNVYDHHSHDAARVTF